MAESHDPLVDVVVQAMSNTIASRHQAAEVLRCVAEDGSAGCFPSDVTCEQLGRAIFRIAMNAPDDDPLVSLLSGWRAAERDFHRRCGCIA